MTNHGIDIKRQIAEESVKDDVFGSFSYPSLVKISVKDRRKYLPKGELQKGKEDTMSCASNSPNNIAETGFNYLIVNNIISKENIKWLAENSYLNADGQFESADAFTAIKSKTTRQGNSLKAPLEAMRKCGLIPRFMLPLEKWMTFDDFHDPKRITEGMNELGLEFARRFPINYEKVYKKDYPKIIKKNLIATAGYSWFPPDKDGVYQKTSMSPNHAFAIIEPLYFIFDSYPDTFDGDFIRHLAPDYDFFKYGYRLTINERTVRPMKINWFTRLLSNIF